MNSYSSSLNHKGYVDRGRSRSQETNHSSSRKNLTRVDFEGRVGYRSPVRHYSYHNQGEHGRLLTFSRDTFGGDGRVVYRSQISHSYSRIGDSIGDIARHGSRYEDINHCSLLNIGEIVDGIGRSGSSYLIIPYPSHHSGDHGRSSGSYSYGENIIGHRSHTRQSSAFNHGEINILHTRFPQEAIPRVMHGEKIHQNHSYYSYPSMTTHPHKIMPLHPPHNMPPHLYPIIPPH